MRNTRTRFGVWLERLTTLAVVLVVAGSIYRAFLVPFPYWNYWAPFALPWVSPFSQLQQTASVLASELDPARREDQIKRVGANLDGKYRWIDARMPPNARVFVLDMLGAENFPKLGFYYYLTYYLYPREVAISLGQPPTFELDRVTGRKLASLEELKQAGYDFAAQAELARSASNQSVSISGVSILTLGSQHLQPEETRLQPIPEGDEIIALCLPLAVSITGSRLVRWLFRDLKGLLSTGELLASGLAVGAFFLTQLTLALRMGGARWEQALAAVLMVWAVGEVVLLVRRCHAQRPQFKARYLWWLWLVPAALILWCQFRLAGLLGLQEFDAVVIWAFKAKILHSCAGREIWTWFQNPGLAYAHMDYPLLVPLLHALTYGALGHVNDFVIKFWNQWMLLFLGLAVLGAGRFPEKRPWLAGGLAGAILLVPMTRTYALMEGATIPMVFYTVLSSVQLAIGMVEQQAGRLRLGLLLLMATAMVKFEGMMLLGFWGVLLLLDRDSREAFWPPPRVGMAGLLGLLAWLPFVVFRLHGPPLPPESGWLSLLLTNTRGALHILPMTWASMLSRRFLHNDFAFWTSPDNQHAAWRGHWVGWQSLVEPWTQGAGWVCALLLVVAWWRGGRLQWVMFRLFLSFMALLTMVSLYWSALQSHLNNYTMALIGSEPLTGGRYLYPVLMAWFVAGVILLLRKSPGEPADPSTRRNKAGTLTGQRPGK
jgi:hypothetical protein